ncbi:MAG: multiple sugar transport system permease protein [Actinomycetota bacterium]|jgi:multiple sugar transport system permease protein|nr:multiple sugar transport system permease protein [Actinomycetota bacterium]MDQ1642508.1 multiple sugar transport system permease protein [Actinomycetota bacterium]
MTATQLPLTAVTTTPPERRRARTRRSLLLDVAEHSTAIALGVIILAPIVLITLTAFMSSGQTLTSNLWPQSWHLSNFHEVFVKAPFLTWLKNSVMYSVLSTVFMLVSSFPAAYALSRLQWRGRNFVLLAVITMMMLPPQVTVVPIYRMWAALNLTGTLWPLILPNLLGDAFSVFLLRQFLLTIPQEYSDAARVDGASELQIMWRVIIPLAKPAIAATSIFMFFFTWNDYFGPLLYTSDQSQNWTVAVGLASFRSLHHVQWNLVMAATVLVMLPVIVLFFFAQKAFVQGVTLTGVKG